MERLPRTAAELFPEYRLNELTQCWVSDDGPPITAERMHELDDVLAKTHDHMTAYLRGDPSPLPTFECPRCGAVSYNPGDVAHRYCGRCDVFVDDLEKGTDL